MRIVAMADTHLWHSRLEVPDGDVLVHAGDLLQGGELEELPDVAAWLQRQPHRHKVVIAGNHDFAFAEAPARVREMLGPRITYLQDEATTVEGVRFYGSPWQPEFGDWAFNLPRGPALAATWAMIPEGTQVLITHGPPRGHGDRTRHGHSAGCDDLLARVRTLRPRLHLFGHIHEDGGVTEEPGTLLVNCTTDECERGCTVIDLDDDGAVRVKLP
jgi:predicted phosphohydrolase